MKKVIGIIFIFFSLYAQNLTQNEKKFISTHTIKCITTPNWAPFNTIRNGKIEGIAIDYWNLIKKKLNLKTQCAVTLSWSKALESIKNKKADLIPATAKTCDKEKFAIFSKPYTTYPLVIATRNNIGFINDMNQLKDKKIVVGKKYSAAMMLKKHYPNLKIIEVENIKKALKMVSDGKAFAAIDNLPVIAYNINKYEFANLKISGKTPLVFKVRFMIRNDYPLLISAINKAIDEITPEEKEKIYKKWLYVLYQTGVDVKKITTIALSAIGIILMLIALVIFLIYENNKRKKIEMDLIKKALTDPLTGLYNRKHLDVVLQKEIEEAKRYANNLSVIFCDIDHFKKVNDNYGHKIGDIVLEEYAKIMQQNIRKSDVLGRWGGEEFLIILPHTSLNQAKKVAEKLREEIKKHHFPKVGNITCSFGVSEYKYNETLHDLMQKVDEALYEAKEKGRDKIITKE